VNQQFKLGLFQLTVFLLLILGLANEYHAWLPLKPLSEVNEMARGAVEAVLKETLVRPRPPTTGELQFRAASVSCGPMTDCGTLLSQLGGLLGTEPRKLEIWYTTALLGALVTVVFAGLGYRRLREKISFREGYALTFLVTVLVSVAAIPAYHVTRVEPAMINLALTACFAFFDYQFTRYANNDSDRHEFTVYLYFIDLPMCLASLFLVILFLGVGIPGDSAFSIGAATGMLMLQSAIYVWAYVYLGTSNGTLHHASGKGSAP
jgi:hypothetical protein